MHVYLQIFKVSWILRLQKTYFNLIFFLKNAVFECIGNKLH